jgi:CRISPR-associated protein Cas1
MLHQIVDVNREGLFISLYRGFIIIQDHGNETGRVSLEDIAVLLITAQGATITKNCIIALAEHGALVIFCGSNYLPVSINYPIANNYRFAGILDLQINASIPFYKQCWKSVIQTKLINQSKTLVLCGKTDAAARLANLSQQVKSGDIDNREGYGAKIYFPALFGEDFIRDRKEEGINSLLNYGYMVMRASMARALCCAGLLPALGIHHKNVLNPFCLADDFLEIYRPLVDYVVFSIVDKSTTPVTLIPDVKKLLVQSIWVKVKTVQGYSPVFQSMQYLSQSYAKALELKDHRLEIPEWEGKDERIPCIEQV